MESMNVNIKLLNGKAVIPFKANDDDANACYDVVATSISHDPDYGFIEYGLGFSTEFSSDWECQIRPRSSVSKYDLLMCNTPGTIDSGYRGEWKVRFKISNPNVTQKINEEREYQDWGEGFGGSSYSSGVNMGEEERQRYIDSLGNFYKIGDRVAQISFHKVTKTLFNKVEELNASLRGDGGFGSTNANA